MASLQGWTSLGSSTWNCSVKSWHVAGKDSVSKHLGSCGYSMSRDDQVRSLVCGAKEPYEVGTAGVEPRHQVCSAPPPTPIYEYSADGGQGRGQMWS